jgi:hypothetical protein
MRLRAGKASPLKKGSPCSCLSLHLIEESLSIERSGKFWPCQNSKAHRRCAPTPFGGYFVVKTASISHFCPIFAPFFVRAYHFGKNCNICDCAKKPAAPAGFFIVKNRQAFYTIPMYWCFFCTRGSSLVTKSNQE